MYGINILLPCPYLMPDGTPRTTEKMKEYEEVTSKQFSDFQKLTVNILNKENEQNINPYLSKK